MNTIGVVRCLLARHAFGALAPSSASTTSAGRRSSGSRKARKPPTGPPLLHRFRANEVRLQLGVIADNLGNLLRRLVLPVAIQSWSLTSLQRWLFKIGGRLIRHARHFTLQLAESYLTRPMFRPIVARIERRAWHPT